MVKTKGLLGILLGAVGALGCTPLPEQPNPRPVGEEPRRPRVVGWRLVERTFEATDPKEIVAGDGVIPRRQRQIVYEPVFEKPKPKRRMYMAGSLTVTSGCAHKVSTRLAGSATRQVGEHVTLECRLASPSGVYHEITIKGTTPAVRVLSVEGASALDRKEGRWLVGARPWKLTFTSDQVGYHGIALDVIREVGEAPSPSIVKRSPRTSFVGR